ncbi:MAG: sodium:solute symporter family protein [Clostridia bacterium]|nr:sodium:solute symporter family protein [Clostridia bacterium]
MGQSTFYIMVGVYTLIIAFCGYLGYRHTKDAKDYLIAGSSVNPALMALSYGSTFISTSAIVGFGGAAGMYGMSLLWLTACNIIFGVFVAFVFFGKRTKLLGTNLAAQTFPELMAKRFDSKFIQRYSAVMIAIAMPLYAAAVMIGGARFLEQAISINYVYALIVFAVLVGIYVFYGGLKGIIYTDAVQAVIMFVGMVFLIFSTYAALGGITEAHQKLTNLAHLVPESLAAQGHTGWTSMPVFGSQIWLYVMTTLVLGVGIGVLAQPHLAVRFMTLKGSSDVNRAVIVGGIFILFMTGVAFVVGALSNAYFYDLYGQISLAMVTDPATGTPNIDKIIPLFIAEALPEWFAYLFMLCLLSAAMSTLSGQFHVIGTSVRDLLQLKDGTDRANTTSFTRMGVLVGLVVTLALGFKLPGSIIAIATAMFFGLCASAFLPMYIAALYWPRASKAGVIAGMLSGSVIFILSVLFVHQKEAVIFGISQLIFGKPYLFGFPWNIIDPMVISLPVGFIVMVAVSLVTAPFGEKHLETCFEGIKKDHGKLPQGQVAWSAKK